MNFLNRNTFISSLRKIFIAFVCCVHSKLSCADPVLYLGYRYRAAGGLHNVFEFFKVACFVLSFY